MKIAIVRGQNLTKFEMQSYEPLTSKYDLTAYTTYNHKFDISEVKIRIKKLHCYEEFAEIVPFPFSRLFLSLIYRSGHFSHMIGLEKELEDKDIAHVTETYVGFSHQAIKTRERHGHPKVLVTVWENIPFRTVTSHSIEVGRKADAFIAVTEMAKEALMLEGIAEGRISVIPVGVDLNRFRPRQKNRELLRRLNLAESDLIVLFVGRLSWEKGVYDLVHAMKMICRDGELRNKSIKCLLVGNGIEKKNILLRAKTLGISDNIRLMGWIPYMEVHEFYNIADIFVLPSIPTRLWQEQFGMVLVEAMASSKAVISTLSGSIPEVVGDCGLLIQPNDPVSLYRAMKKLLTDEELRESIGKKGRIRVEERFDSEKIANKIGEVYETMIS